MRQVSVHGQYVFARGLFEACSERPAKTWLGLMDQDGACRRTDVCGGILRMIVHDDHLALAAQCRQCLVQLRQEFGEIVCFVESGKNDAEFHVPPLVQSKDQQLSPGALERVHQLQL